MNRYFLTVLCKQLQTDHEKVTNSKTIICAVLIALPHIETNQQIKILSYKTEFNRKKINSQLTLTFYAFLVL